jgi:hypothetical protein
MKPWRGKKRKKQQQLAGLGLYCQALMVKRSQIYVGATKEAQAKTLWEQAFAFVEKSILLRSLGFRNTQREIRFSHTPVCFVFAVTVKRWMV